MIELYPEFYNDVFGPIMQPGSSSHMAAPCRAGYLCNSILGEEVAEILVELDNDGSFKGTFGTMNEDLGMLNGSMGHPSAGHAIRFRAEKICHAWRECFMLRLCRLSTLSGHWLVRTRYFRSMKFLMWQISSAADFP